MCDPTICHHLTFPFKQNQYAYDLIAKALLSLKIILLSNTFWFHLFTVNLKTNTFDPAIQQRFVLKIVLLMLSFRYGERIAYHLMESVWIDESELG